MFFMHEQNFIHDLSKIWKKNPIQKSGCESNCSYCTIPKVAPFLKYGTGFLDLKTKEKQV